jgi:hypothetical protein
MLILQYIQMSSSVTQKRDTESSSIFKKSSEFHRVGIFLALLHAIMNVVNPTEEQLPIKT